MLHIHQFPCLSDNYGFLVHDSESGETATVDTPEAARILAEAAAKQGHLVLAHVPMQALGKNDPGPMSLKTAMPASMLRLVNCAGPAWDHGIPGCAAQER